MNVKDEDELEREVNLHIHVVTLVDIIKVKILENHLQCICFSLTV